MSVEVHESTYLFAESPTPLDTAITPEHRVQTPDSSNDNVLDGPRGLPRRPPPAYPSEPIDALHHWFYNPLHDLESVWWMMAFFLFTKELRPVFLPGVKESDEFVEDADNRASRVRRQEQFAAKLFLTASGTRRLLVITKMFSARLSHYLPPALYPLGLELERARDALVQCYRAAERDIASIDHQVAEGAHTMLRDCLDSMVVEVSNDEFDLQIAMSIYKASRQIKQKDAMKGSGSV